MQAEPLPDRATFFESHVRPLLLEHCVQCHGDQEQSGQLRLDRSIDLDRKVGSGPIIHKQDPSQSLLLRAVAYQDSQFQMPPDGKLSDQQIEILTAWVRDGAYWPADPDSDSHDTQPLSPTENIDQIRQTHWAFQPVSSPPLPEVTAEQWVRQPLDQFILAKLEQAGLSPSPQADRRTLMLRAHFAVTGLPPSYQEVEQFVGDPAANALEHLVDRLLDSPHYGERWARHWLDVARFAETMGYLPGSVDTTYPYAYTYRDYVIQAFNSDKPFDQFVIEQLAADLLPPSGDQQASLAALGFLTVGRKFMNRQPDIIDDRIDVVTRGFMGMSVGCARCHDHKYDPISMADYYGLYGVFASCQEPAELPLLGDPAASPLYGEFLAAQAEKQQVVDDWLEKKRIATEQELRSRVADYLIYLADVASRPEAKDIQQKGPRGVLRPPAINRWREYLSTWTTQSHPVWTLWHKCMALPPEDYVTNIAALLTDTSSATNSPSELQAVSDAQPVSDSQSASELALSAEKGSTSDSEPPSPAATASWLSQVNPGLLQKLRADPPTNSVQMAGVIGHYIERVYQRWTDALKESSSLTQLPDQADEELRVMLFAADTPTSLDRGQMLAHLNQAERNDYNQQLSKVKAVESQHPGAPGRAMVLVDQATPHEPVIFLRGQPGNRGDRVPRRFLQVLSHVDGGQPFAQGSGRLELARAIAHPSNPLTPRVIVNRIWQYHFGHGLVRTASDFGARGEPPTHPELLDHLAAEFVADGWSIKRLQRRIMLSATWQQASAHRPEANTIDPENRLLWRMPRQRLEFEPLRDRLLAATGQLELQVGGRSVKIDQQATRRALYTYVDREDVPSLLASFDVPSPDASQAKRSRTTVPQQALYLMNSQLVINQAQLLAQQSAEFTSDSQRVEALYRRILGRDPDDVERTCAVEFIEQFASELGDHELPTNSPSQAVWRFGYGYVDPGDEKVRFTGLAHFTGQRWQASEQFPDAKLQYVSLAVGAGHPGHDQQHSTVLRWVAPGSGTVAVRGKLKHAEQRGDGVRARLISSRLGELASWQVFGEELSTVVRRIQVQAGDMLDFIVDCRQSPDFDSYQWAPIVRSLIDPQGDLQPRTVWDSANDFQTASQPPAPAATVDAWVQLAQALLASNEFAFVD
ncbi:MAG: PSD1 domain-containing protein [Pirellulaceae bacterium]|nr:PSD1 domain-containing protein [Pirellulaceae bacterium]